MGDGARAHGTRFERYVKIATVKPPGAANRQRRADGQHFGMSGRVVQLPHAVAFGGEHLAVFNQYGPNGGLAMRGRLGGKAERHIHVGEPGIGH